MRQITVIKKKAPSQDGVAILEDKTLKPVDVQDIQETFSFQQYVNHYQESRESRMAESYETIQDWRM